MKYLAHIADDRREQTVAEHLQGTAELAARFAAAFGAEADGRFAGLLHDIGKYTPGFQKRLHGGPPVDHSTAGAREAFSRYGNAPAALAIAGHHGGIPDAGNPHDPPDEPTLLGRVKRPCTPDPVWMQEISVPVPAPPAWLAANDLLQNAFYTRMLYSCLVDADFQDTQTFMDGAKAPRGRSAPLTELLKRVRAQAQRFLCAQQPSAVAQQRNAALRACMEHGRAWKQGLYTLTIPTGGGKTFASLAFALEHAVAQNMDRVIYVIPYTSIIDQTVETFSGLLGEENVLAHYAGVDYQTAEPDEITSEQYRKLLASENWDAPVVVTTAVQFFESLYANRSSRCRKLHNIANSVIIFDEAQTLPTSYLLPCVSAIAQLVRHYHATAVLCTATQPALEPYFRQFAPELPLQEIVPDTATLYTTLRRTTLCDAGELTLEALTSQLCALPQVLCVVNRRKTAQEVYAALPAEGSYCLTTLLCAADRRRQLAEIRQRLRESLPCRVVSTSLIEAGVDVDFPAAYREQCGLDSLLQTAGRCNREGHRSAEESLVYRFTLEGCGVPQMLRQNVHAMQYAAGCTAALDSPEAVRAYFKELYFARGEAALDTSSILDALRKGISGCIFPFAQVAEQFHLIEAPTRTVYLPVGEGKALCDQLRSGTVSRTLYRKLGAYSVACYAQQFQALESAGALEPLPNGSAILTDSTLYDPKTGLSMDVETGKGLFF